MAGVTRQELFRHIRRFCKDAQARELLSAVERNILYYRESMAGQPRHRFCGARTVQVSGKRRLKDIYLPPRPVGRPPNDQERVLVSFLAASFTKATGRAVTLNREGDVSGCSCFEAFVTPVLQLLGIRDARGKISEHLKRRRIAGF